MPEAELFAPDFKALPYWWEKTPRPELGEPALPAHADVVVVGSGYTGLNAALQTARGGRSTLVLDAEAAGWGCSTRNGGQVSSSVKPSFSELAARHGEERARRIIAEGHRSLAWLGEFVAEERIDCDYRVCGHLHAAHSARQYEALAQAYGNPPKELRGAVHLVPRSEQTKEIGTDVYHGGIVYSRHAALDPARYHRGLLERVVGAGATIVPHCAVTAIERQGNGFRVTTARGDVDRARCDRRHQRLFRPRDAMAPAARHPDRQLHHRHRADPARDDGPAVPDRPHRHRHAKSRLLLSRLARPHPHPLRRPRLLERDRSPPERAAPPRRDGPALPRARRRARVVFLDGLRRLHVRPASCTPARTTASTTPPAIAAPASAWRAISA